MNVMLVPSSSGATPSGALSPCSRWGGLPEVTWTQGHGPWQTDQSRCGWLIGNGWGSWATPSPTLSLKQQGLLNPQQLVRGPRVTYWCPARDPRGWGKGWMQQSVADKWSHGGAPQRPRSRGPAAAGVPRDGQGGTGAGQESP